jgi:hypothetical protein
MNEEEIRQAAERGDPIPVWLGDDELPIGDVGNGRTDRRLLLAILAVAGQGARLLRGAGVDEAAVESRLPGDRR